MMVAAQRKEEEKIAKQRERDREQGMAYQRKEAEKSAAERARSLVGIVEIMCWYMEPPVI